ncbi:hypothetical protein LCGC14_0567890 [marine sediment metagenome]|uniref:Uncharacterized protein n=1 Tax=marine sediment metagenome TaxID=412755 RepID=A0A0F9RQA5_9ZZZZ
MSEGSRRIAAERQRQIEVERWTAEHDDAHSNGCLAAAAAAYALRVASTEAQCDNWTTTYGAMAESVWPFDEDWWKPSSDPVRDLERAGALIAAEIDRLLRAAR